MLAHRRIIMVNMKVLGLGTGYNPRELSPLSLRNVTPQVSAVSLEVPQDTGRLVGRLAELALGVHPQEYTNLALFALFVAGFLDEGS